MIFDVIRSGLYNVINMMLPPHCNLTTTEPERFGIYTLNSTIVVVEFSGYILTTVTLCESPPLELWQLV